MKQVRSAKKSKAINNQQMNNLHVFRLNFTAMLCESDSLRTYRPDQKCSRRCRVCSSLPPPRAFTLRTRQRRLHAAKSSQAALCAPSSPCSTTAVHSQDAPRPAPRREEQRQRDRLHAAARGHVQPVPAVPATIKLNLSIFPFFLLSFLSFLVVFRFFAIFAIFRHFFCKILMKSRVSSAARTAHDR